MRGSAPSRTCAHPCVVQVFQEIVHGIKVVKAYGWESSFLKNILATRRKESASLLTMNYLQAVIFPISFAMPILAIATTFSVRVAVEGNE